MGVAKYKVSISVDEMTLLGIREAVRQGRFRNRSHAFEYAIQAMLEANQ